MSYCLTVLNVLLSYCTKCPMSYCTKCPMSYCTNCLTVFYTSVMIYHRGASLNEQHNDLLCTKQDLSHTSRYVDESSPEILHTYANS